MNKNEPIFAVLSMNPGIDRTLMLASPFCAGELNRAANERLDTGSKGSNVAMLLSRLGERVEFYSFSGGIYGGLYESIINKEIQRSYFVSTARGLRENVKIIDSAGVCTEVNSSGGPFSEAETEALLGALLESDAGAVCLCGSIPQGVEKSVYNSLIKKLRAAGKICILDCDGEAMKLGIAASPDIIKPNMREAEEIFRSYGLKITKDRKITPVENPWEDSGKILWNNFETIKNVANICGEISYAFSVRVLCTLGGMGALVAAETENDGILYCPAPRLKLKGFAGAGDSSLAAYISSFFSKSYENDEARERSALLSAVAAGSAKVMLEGSLLPRPEDIERVLGGPFTA